MVSVMGAFFGVCLGAIIVLLQQYFNFVMISSTLAYPVEIKWFNVFAVFAHYYHFGLFGFVVGIFSYNKKND
ncbi:hypothetical protein CCAN11_2090007 [Capnocytophaga canimorsus]|uniref:Uncharacterized protein n=1 Tax=Capnocytophaga canimorsus TaxID=28188 RepID=A0A0B7IJE1_9FLAO|nr:hypothetical protein CCAN11_2090007 [Capnocytophaga canimorsus]